MPAITSSEAFFAALSDAVYRKDVAGYLELYDDNVVVFDMWQQWTYKGLAAWRVMVSGWFSGLGTDRDRVTFRDTQIETSGDLGYITAIARFAAVSEAGEELRFLDNRLTWVIRRSGASWTIIHQHTSGPIDFNTMKVVLEMKG
jgi:ketosteroid isomerase-like protein